MTDSTTAPPTYGQAIRVSASLPNQPDAVLSIAAPAAGSTYHDAATPLGLVAGTGTPHPAFNVAHYALGTGHDNSDGTSYGSQAASVPGGDGTGLPAGDPATFTGIYALDKVDLLNLLSIIDAVQPSGRA